MPSTLLTQALDQGELEYAKIIDNCIYLEDVTSTRVASLMKEVQFQNLMCQTCHLHDVIVHLMDNIKLHHTTREANIKLRDQKEGKNRKTMKFSHM